MKCAEDKDRFLLNLGGAECYYKFYRSSFVFIQKGGLMRKRMWVIGIFIVLTVAVCASAYAGGENCPVHGFFSSLGGFLYNALPWNWGSWMGK